MANKKIVIRTPGGEEVETSKRALITKTLAGYRHRQKPKTAHELDGRIADYFQFCQDTDTVPSIEVLSAAIGISRQSLFRWCKGMHCPKEWQELVLRARQTVYASIESAGIEGDMPMPLAIFQLKSFGWTEGKPLEDITGYAPDEIAAVNPKALLEDYKSEYGIESSEDLDRLADDFMDIEAKTVELPEWLEDGDYDA